jgi:hypothetical protein
MPGSKNPANATEPAAAALGYAPTNVTQLFFGPLVVSVPPDQYLGNPAMRRAAT